jgi:hypothetical protein
MGGTSRTFVTKASRGCSPFLSMIVRMAPMSIS